MQELKPCPFCGGEAKIMKYGHREYRPTYSVRCTEYSCRVETSQEQLEKEAVAKWNRRKE